MSKSRALFLVIMVCASVVALFIFSAGESNEPDYSMYSTGPNGVSLLSDTLRRIGFNVLAGFEPITINTDVNDVYIVVLPYQADKITAEDILSWVRRGGRLIYLDNADQNEMDFLLAGNEYQMLENYRYYRFGLGDIITGNADSIINNVLMENTIDGRLISGVLNGWNPDRVRFAEYYHGFRATDNFFTRLPTIIKLCIYQIAIAAVALIWHLGKRFGKPIPFYEETERTGDEYVRALARVYYRIGSK